MNEASILGIIDHHMLVGGLKTTSPIDITIRPLACTATVMHDLMGSDLAKAPRAIKGAMLSCILSDTMEFRSPTTTPHDRAVAEKLASDLGVNIATLAAEMFAAKSDVSRFSDAELLRMDSKEYELGGKQLRISVLETTSPKVVLDRKDSLMRSMVEVAKEDGADQVLLFVIDILKEEATLLVPNDLVKTSGRSLLRGQGLGRHGRPSRHHEPQEADHPDAEDLTPAGCVPPGVFQNLGKILRRVLPPLPLRGWRQIPCLFVYIRNPYENHTVLISRVFLLKGHR